MGPITNHEIGIPPPAKRLRMNEQIRKLSLEHTGKSVLHAYINKEQWTSYLLHDLGKP